MVFFVTSFQADSVSGFCSGCACEWALLGMHIIRMNPVKMVEFLEIDVNNKVITPNKCTFTVAVPWI